MKNVPQACLAPLFCVLGGFTSWASLAPLSRPHTDRESKLGAYSMMGYGLLLLSIGLWLTVDWYRRSRDERIRNEDV